MTAKPHIRKGEFSWYCFGPILLTGTGDTPRAAYLAWWRKAFTTMHAK